MSGVPETSWPYVAETPHDATMTWSISRWCRENLTPDGWMVTMRRSSTSDPLSLGLDQHVVAICTRDPADHLLAAMVWC
jgi:hypothetical protein